MKKPRKPPKTKELESCLLKKPEKLSIILENALQFEQIGKYYHFDILRHLAPPKGLTIPRGMVGYKTQSKCSKKNSCFGR